jgi:hypothetical protein
MSVSPQSCPRCRQPVQAGQSFCPSCGTSLGTAGTPAPVALRSLGADGFAGSEQILTSSKAEERTKTGFVIMIVAFALLWIPYVSDLGELLAFVGVIFLWLGRSAFTHAHSRSVAIGSVSVILGLVLGLVIGFSFAAGLLSAATTPGETSTAFVATLQSSFTLLFASGIAVTVLTAGGYLALPYALADATSRRLLWGGFALSVAISVLVFVFLTPLIASALAQATAGGTINPGPVQALETKELLWDLTLIVPNVLFLWAYYRTRAQVFPPAPAPPQLPPLPSQSGRFD